MKYDIVTFGIPIVELMRKELDVPLTEEGEFVGPFPAGDPGITINACAALGHKSCYVGAVGDDLLADCFLQSMRKHKVDTTRIRRVPPYTTGISLLAKFSDGSRSFIFTVPTSAAAQMGPQDLDAELVKNVKWIHISGFALSISDSIVELHRQILRLIDDKTMVSFDPNYRKEIVGLGHYKKICAESFERCNLFLPSHGEAGPFCGEATDELDACRRIAAKGKMVGLKLGNKGSHGFLNGRELYVPPFPTREIDPTGAGDTFGGALIASLIEGRDFFEAVRRGAAAGAFAVSRMGLMDIAPTQEELDEVLTRA